MERFNIKFRITIWYAALLLILLSFFSSIVYETILRLLYNSNIDLLKADSAQVESILMFEGSMIKFAEPYKIVATNTYFIIFDSKGNANLQNEALPEITNLPINEKKVRYIDINKQTWAVYDKAIINNGQLYGWIRVGRSMFQVVAALERLRIILFSAVPLYILLSSLGGYFLADRALKPIDYITKTARKISQGDINQRINLPKKEDEVGRLVTTFNEMLEKISISIKKERQFSSDASHELRTPVSIISAYAEQALSTGRKEDEYIEALKNILNESKKMSFIISQLLLLYRGEEGQYKPSYEKFNLNMVVEEIINEYKNIISDNKIFMRFNPKEKILIKADQTLITRLFINLLDNAIKYNKDKGSINIGLEKDQNMVKITVEDSGLGIPPKDIPHIFDRFYQVDKTMNIMSTGLGLSIVKWIVEMHNGQIAVDSKINTGTKFSITLPLNLD
jgi:heavy metal sensor kinase